MRQTVSDALPPGPRGRLARLFRPGIEGFALLAGIDAAFRGLLVSVWPLLLYRALGDARAVSRVFFIAGIAALAAGLMMPYAARFLPRRWLYTGGVLLYLVGPALALGPGPLAPAGYALTAIGTVTTFICLNAYVMDVVPRPDLGRGETLKMLFSAAGWTAGPLLGTAVMAWWAPAPFLIGMALALVHLAAFWAIRLGDGRSLARARPLAPNPLAYLGRFARQPRLVAGWLFAVIRSCGWWIYVVYLPIFCIEAGLGGQLGGVALSISNALLFLAPRMQRWVERRPLRQAVRAGFLGAAALFTLATAGTAWPPVAVVALMAGSAFLVLLDLCGGLPFLMAVKPSERSEMAAVYSSFRDVSGIVTPGIAWLVLSAAPVAAIFAAGGAMLGGAWALAGRLHPRLGAGRPG